MKILYYNWVPYDYHKIVGGGVQVYQKNLIDKLLSTDSKDEIYFLSSGFKYNPFKRKTYFRKSQGSHDKRIKSYEIINSPILSPMVIAGSDIKKYTNNETIVNVFSDFIDYCGGFDVIHINNFEGITPSCMKIKEKYPNTKIVFSVHNYIPICPRAQYFQEKQGCICKNFCNGKECVKCFQNEMIAYNERNENVYRFLKMAHIPRLLSKIISKVFYRSLKKYFPAKHLSTAEDFKKFRESNIEYINKYVDIILAVSQRVADICIEHGMDPKKVKCSYIGTKFADNALDHRHNTTKKDDFTICYLGYARQDKGYFFMVDALSQLPTKYKKMINIVIAARGVKEPQKLSGFKSISIYDGYTHNNINDILANVDLGIVPVIWEDNLPQVAIEMSALGVPVLASSFGGASELTKSNLFRFQGADAEDFRAKLIKLIDDPDLLDEYYKRANKLQTMDGHIKELKNFYSVKK